MVKFTQKLDSSGKIYLPKLLRKAGFDSQVEILPNSIAAVMYPAGTRPSDVLDSLRTITIQLQALSRFEKRKSNR